MEESKAQLEAEKESATVAVQEVTDLIKWAEEFDKANTGTKHMILTRLIERINVGRDYEIEIKFRISVEQYMKIAA